MRQSFGGATGSSESECLGRVVTVADGKVVVEVDSSEECASCAAKSSCHAAGMGSSSVEIAAVGFSVGERVRVIASTSAVIKASFVLYLLPALLVLFGSFAGYAAAEAFTTISGDTGAGIGVIVGLVLGILFLHFYKSARADDGISLKLERID